MAIQSFFVLTDYGLCLRPLINADCLHNNSILFDKIERTRLRIPLQRWFYYQIFTFHRSFR